MGSLPKLWGTLVALSVLAPEIQAFSPTLSTIKSVNNICAEKTQRAGVIFDGQHACALHMGGADEDSADNKPVKGPVSNDDVLNAAINALYGGGPVVSETPAETQARIQKLVQSNPILLFMKGSKAFPQCGFSDTATKILEQYGCEFETVDVLSDAAIRQGVKEYSQWPTIPQLYVKGDFVGGSDIMLQMYESGELKELIEEATSS